jgi:hypothetical protein
MFLTFFLLFFSTFSVAIFSVEVLDIVVFLFLFDSSFLISIIFIASSNCEDKLI